MKPREFWCNPGANYRTDHILTKEEYNEMEAEFPHSPNWILVREVSPELDAAYEKCERALEILNNGPVGNIFSKSNIANNALAALKKAKRE